MKQCKSLIILFFFFAIISSCKKSDIYQPSNTSATNSKEVSLLKDGSVFTLSIRPGQKNSQDVYVVEEAGTKSGNVNYVPELSIASWTVNGNLYTSGCYIRFDELTKVPQSAKVISAELHLYSLPSSISTPQGNYGNNACVIKRVTQTWDESEINFTNKPASTYIDAAILPPSTNQWNYNPVIDVSKLVTYMVAHPDQNFGFYIRLKKQEIYRSMVFGSSEQPTSNFRPKLVIKYIE